MAGYKDLSDALTDEVMSEMADSFFGARIDIDEALDFFHDISEKLNEKLYRVFRACALLEAICLERGSYEDFWKTAGIEGSFNFPPGVKPARLIIDPTFSFTSKGEYIKWFKLAYDLLSVRVIEYMHGVYRDDGSGRMLRSANREDFFRMADEINVKIRKVNENVSASDVLKFTKSLDPEGVKKENIAGCVGPQCKVIDDEMAFKVITVKDIDFPEFPDLPKQKDVSHHITKFCSGVYSKDKERVKSLLILLRESVK